MPLNFPSNPSLNDTYTLGDKKWVYDGKGWKLFSASFELVPIVYAHANGAFDKANSANSLAQAAFDAANNAGSSAEIQTIFTHANGAFDKANSANVLAQSAYDIAVTDVTSVSVTANNYGSSTIVPVMRIEANGRISSVSNVSITFPVTSVGGNTGVVTNQNLLDSIKQVDGSGSELDADLLDGLQGSSYANSIFTQSAFDKANLANVLAQNAYDFANTRYSSSGGTISGDVQISGNLIIVGNTVTHSANDFIVNDPIILLANNNVGNILDIGFVAHYEDGGANTKHTGLVRHVSTNTWYLFENYEPHIQETNVLNIAHPTLATSNIKANLFGNANTAATWQTARTITIGSTGKSVDGSAPVSWTLSEIGAQTSGSYVTTDTAQTIGGVKTFANNFLIASTTVIANLNADLLDGQHGSYYSNATNINAGTLNAARLPTVGTAGTYGNSTHVPVITTDAYGRVSSVANVAITVTGGGGGSITWTRKTANYTAVNGDRIIADTSAGSFVITLPATPSIGDVIVIADGNSWSANTLNVARNGATIEGYSEDLQLDIAGIRVDLVYDGTTWEAYTFASPQTSINNDNTTNTNQYPTMARSTSGSLLNSYVSSTKLYFNPSSGALNATDFNSLSDASLKEDITNIPNVMNIIDSIKPVEFKWKDNNKKSYGVIAQEIEKVLPEIVSTNQDTNLKSVSYVQLIPVLLEAIKELKSEVEFLKKKKRK